MHFFLYLQCLQSYIWYSSFLKHLDHFVPLRVVAKNPAWVARSVGCWTAVLAPKRIRKFQSPGGPENTLVCTCRLRTPRSWRARKEVMVR